MDLRKIGLGGADWIDLVQVRDQWRALVNTVMNLRVPKNFGKFLSSFTPSDWWLLKKDSVPLSYLVLYK
jgi:hypothetical protein